MRGRPASRTVEPEWLDHLSPADPRAVRSRRDLRRVNAIMGNASSVAGALRRHLQRPPRTVLDLGAGDGAWLARLAQALPAGWAGVHAILLDRQDTVAGSALGALAARRWFAEVVQADALAWLQAPGGRIDLVVANLFLHHFPPGTLRALLSCIAARCAVFVACEPHRSSLALHASRLLRLAGCSAVTCHDAVVSVRAGFHRAELAALWPQAGWHIEERRCGAFGHLFVAVRGAEASVR